jgi:signal transduction histidine kinase/ligand-binding sensor domain-containing protein
LRWAISLCGKENLEIAVGSDEDDRAPRAIILSVVIDAPKSPGVLSVVAWAVVATVAPNVQVAAASAIPQPRMAPEAVHVPVIEGSDLKFRRLSTADGLSQTRVEEIVQDDRGFIWFGTQYGLNRFDGYEFKVFVHDPRNANSLSGVVVTALFKDRSGALWVGCNQFLDRFDPRTETFTPIGRFGGAVVHISQDRSDTLWLATEDGLYSLDPTTRKITRFGASRNDASGLPTQIVTWTGHDRSGGFWVGTSAGLERFDEATGQVTYHVPIGQGVPFRQGLAVSFFEDRQGLFWITYHLANGLALLDRQSNTLARYSFYDREPPASAATGVMGILEDSDGDLWLGSFGIGLLRFDRQRRFFVHYGNHPADPQSIAEDKIIALFQDRDGNIWTGLHSKGPNVFARSMNMFETFKHEVGNPKSLSTDFVSAIYEDSGGSLWIGNDEGLNRVDRATGSRTLRTMGLGPKPTVITITQDHSGLIWFGTYGRGLVAFDPKTGHSKFYRHVPSDPRSLSSNAVYRVLVGRSDVLWVGTGDGLNRFDAQTQSFTVYKEDWNSSDAQAYLSMAEDTEGKIWLGTHHSGLHRFDPATGQFTVYQSEPGDDGALPDNSVAAVLISRTGVVWAGTENGLARLDPRTGRFASYDVLDGLAGNAVACILEDREGVLWVSTNKGLSRFDPATRTFLNYSEMDGLPGNDLSGWNTCYKSSRGEMFFGGFPGAVAFFPDRLRERPGAPAVVLTDFKVSGKSVPIAPDSPLTQSITYTDRVTLSHTQNMFSITFAGLDYLSSQSTRYRYRLEGLEQQWNEVGSDQRHATYTTLPAGQYTLRVQAARSRGSWNNGATLAIEILPPWWETWWLRTVVGLLLMLTAWLFYRLRIRQVSRQLTIRMEERLGERTRIAQELHDTVLQGLASASLQLEVADRQIAGDATAKPLVRRVSQLLRHLSDESRQTVRGLRLRHSEEENLERALTQISKDLAAPHKVKYQVVVEGTPRSLQALVRDEIYRIGGEALANAFSHARASTVETVLEYGRDHFRLLVRDDGKGIDPEVLKGGREGHFGLSGLRERASRIGALLKIRTGPGAGTEIDMLVPAAAAFQRPAPRGLLRWIGKLHYRGSPP